MASELVGAGSAALATDKDRGRLKELFKYLKSTVSAVGHELKDIDSLSEYDIRLARISADPILNALTQLGPLKLSCDRAFVSLIDDSEQYVIAEATRSCSLYSNDKNDLCIGARPLDLATGICASTIAVFTGTSNISTSNVQATPSRYVINDLSKHEVFGKRPYVMEFPYMRWYCEVPLLSHGHVIGSYALIDNKARPDLNEEEHVVLKEIADAIIQHLILVKTRDDQVRAERLLIGLDTFVNGQGRRTEYGIPEGPRSHSQSGEKVATEESIRPIMRSPTTTPSASNQAIENLNGLTSSTVSDQTTTMTSPDMELRNFNFDRTTTESRGKPQLNSSSENAAFTKDAEFIDRDVESEEIAVEEICTRATNLLREALDLDVLGLFDCSATLDSNDTLSPGSSTFPDRRMSIEESLTVVNKDTTARSIGLATRPESAPLKSNVPSLPASMLRRLCKLYPRGRTFQFDHSGVCSSNEGRSLETLGWATLSVEEKMRYTESQESDDEDLAILQALPSARSAIFMPLWHPYKEVWFAGILGWTIDPQRVCTVQDLAYSLAFGNTLMAEISKQELLMTNRKKSNFIASVSHELRSPLHGILGSTELLKGISHDPEQQDMLSMIENCGRTLLDTLAHVLDFAKINHSTQMSQKPGSSSTLTASHSQSDEMPNPVNLCVLTEELVEAVLIGHHSNISKISHSERRSSRPNLVRQVSKQNKMGFASIVSESLLQRTPTVVLISLDKSLYKTTVIESGAWRRILMNLLGNSLKYTKSGLIEIALTPVVDPNRIASIIDSVNIHVKDTGQGISKDYMQHHLFHPFEQENAMSRGVGLGLSLVQQIVESLKGKVNISTEVGVGTDVMITIPLLPSKPITTLLSPADNGLPKLQYEGCVLCLLAFNLYPSLETNPSGILCNESKAAIRLKSAFTDHAENWFGFKVIFAQDTRSIPSADIYAVHEDHLHTLKLDENDGMKSFPGLKGSPLLVLGSALITKKQFKRSSSLRYLSQPYGPQQMNKAFRICFKNDKKHIPDSLSRFELKSDKVQTISVADKTLTKYEQYGVRPSVDAEKSLAVVEEVSIVPLTVPRLLLVDDNDINLKMLVSYARRLKYEFAVASDGFQALEVYRHSGKSFDVVFMDMSMPVMDGFKSSQGIRDFENSKGLPATKIIALTGLGDANARQEAFGCGIDIFLTKPVRMARIRELIEKTMEQKIAR